MDNKNHNDHQATRDHDAPVSPPWTLGQRAGAALLVVLLPAILVLEWTSGNALSVHLVYLVPIAIAAWTSGYRTGGVVAIASALDVRSGAMSARETERMLEGESRRARRYARPLSLVLLDIEARNDDVVPRFVDALRRHVRECDAVGRLTRRRFLLVLVECPNTEAARVMKRCAEMLRQGFPDALRFDVGAVSYGGMSPTTAGQLLHMAETHLAASRVAASAPPAQPQLA